jgi:beta-galactosidase
MDIQKTAKTGLKIELVFGFPDSEIKHHTVYSFFPSGDVLVFNEMETSGMDLPEMPRFGMKIQLSDKLDRLVWLGRGPHENYQDRYTSAFVDIYESSVDEQYYPYVRPQENGYKTDTRWLALTDHQGIGLKITGKPLFSFSALPYSIDDLDQGTKKNYRHTNDLVPGDFVELMVDFKQMGLGGDDSWWARPHRQYQLLPGKYAYSFRMSPVFKPLRD